MNTATIKSINLTDSAKNRILAVLENENESNFRVYVQEEAALGFNMDLSLIVILHLMTMLLTLKSLIYCLIHFLIHIYMDQPWTSKRIYLELSL